MLRVGGLLADDHAKRVVLPAPLGPITPTMPAQGEVEGERLDEQSIAEALGDTVGDEYLLAQTRAGGEMWIWTSSSLTLRSSATSSS